MAMWAQFLKHPTAYCQPFIDYTDTLATELDLYSDTSRNFSLGMGAIFSNRWMVMQWLQEFQFFNPSIEYLELYALCAAVLSWVKYFKNKRVIIFCDNISVVHMVNNSSSTCMNCMVLIRLLTLECLFQITRIFASHVRTEVNSAADALSRLDWNRFKKVTSHKHMLHTPDEIPVELLPLSKIWLK